MSEVPEVEVPEGWCDAEHVDHDWRYGDLSCRRCDADLSSWNDEYDEEMDS